MKKLALAAALTAAFAGSAYAQSSVQVYGRINTSFEYQDNNSGSNDTTTGMRSNGSRFGFRGTEDLGSGLNAFFQLEGGFDSSSGEGDDSLFGRDAYVGLKSKDLGQLKLGRFTSGLYYGTLDYIGVFNHNTGTTSEDNIWSLNRIFMSNGVEYTSPKMFGGAEFIAAVWAGENSGPDTYELSVNYDVGNLHVGAGYSETKGTNGAGLPGSDTSGFAIAASYVFGPLTVGLAYDYVDAKGYLEVAQLNAGNAAFVNNPGDRGALTGTAMYTLGASEFHLSVGSVESWSNVSSSNSLQYTLGYNYNLSKRTKVYGFFYAIDNNALAYGGGSFSSPVEQETFSSIGLGIRHNF